MKIRSLTFTLPLAFCACTTMGTHASLPASGQFVTQLGVDTISIERYVRTPGRLEGDLVLRSPRVRVAHYVAALGSGGEIRSLTMSVRRPSNPASAPAGLASTITFGPSTTVEVMRNGQRDTSLSKVRTYSGAGVPTLPSEPASYGLYEQILATHPVAGSDSVMLTQIGSPGAPVAALHIVRRGADSVAFNSDFFPGTPWTEVAAVDARGRILGMNSMGTTVKTLSHRDDALDFNAVLNGWIAREAAGSPMGQTSLPDTVRATAGSAKIQIAYSRPMRRGRVIFGNVVPWGEVWRFGANAATELMTSADLVFGSTVLPAGKYTLFMLPASAGSTLIINRQTGQWGTDYDRKRDLARLDLTSRTLASPVEPFTISVDPSGNGGTLRFSWDRTEYSIPFTTR